MHVAVRPGRRARGPSRSAARRGGCWRTAGCSTTSTSCEPAAAAGRLAADGVRRRRSGRAAFRNGDIPTEVVRNGAYFDRTWLPVHRLPAERGAGGRGDAAQSTGCRRSAPRARRGRPAAAAVALRPARRGPGARGRRHRHGRRTRSPSPPARCVREWRENGRRYFHYRTDAPLPFMSPFLSARYAVREERWSDVALRVFHHPAHDVNVERMVAQHEGVAGLLQRAVRPVPVPRAAHRGVSALRELRPRASAHHRVLGGECVPHAGGGGRRGPHLLRHGARDRAPVVGRAGDGRQRARQRPALGDAGAVQRHDGDGKGAGPGAGAPVLRLRDGPLPPGPARLLQPRGAAAGRGGPVVPVLPQGRRGDVHPARAHRRGGA